MTTSIYLSDIGLYLTSETHGFDVWKKRAASILHKYDGRFDDPGNLHRVLIQLMFQDVMRITGGQVTNDLPASNVWPVLAISLSRKVVEVWPLTLTGDLNLRPGATPLPQGVEVVTLDAFASEAASRSFHWE